MTSFEPTIDSFDKVKNLVKFIEQIPCEDGQRLTLLLESMEYGELRIPVDLIERLSGKIPSPPANTQEKRGRGSAWALGGGMR